MDIIKILLADSQYLTRFGIKHLIASEKKLQCIAEVENSTDLLETVQKCQPNLLIFDYDDTEAFCQEDIKKIKEVLPSLKILIVSEDKDKSKINQALNLGANGFLTKYCGEEEIKDAIFATARGSKFFCDKVLDILLDKNPLPEDVSCLPTELTAREIEVVKMVTTGMTPKEIAYDLNLSLHTIYTHRKNVMKKLGIKTESELVFYAIKTGIAKKIIS